MKKRILIFFVCVAMLASSVFAAKWFSESNYFSGYSDYFIYGFLIILLIVVMLIIWNITLKNKVKRSTAELRGALEKLKESENKNIAIINAIPDLILTINKKGRIKDLLSQHTNNRILIKNDEFEYTSIEQIFPTEICNKFFKSIQKLEDTNEMQRIDFKFEDNDEIYSFEARFVLVESKLILTIIRDITEQKKSEKKIYEMSMKDAMTGLRNRYFFEKQIRKYKEQGFSNIGIVVCDLDGLKLVNDTSGHGEGDKYIQKAARIIRQSFKKEDIVARIGGDEFAVLLRDTSDEEIKSIKTKMQELIDEENVEDQVISISISIGYSISTDKDKTIDDIFKEADDYMYHEKLHHHQSAKSKNVEILSKMLEARDFITEGHGERMEKLVTELAIYLGFRDSVVKDMALFAEFHDIGKVGIPDAILFKAGKLNDEENLIMKRHSEIGYSIAQDSPDLKYISDWILKHHECWNGSGYPFGLKGEEIPIQCRILAIVDAYDAMTNDRPYRKALTKEEAVSEIRSCSGEQFDPAITEKFLKMIS